MAGCAQTQASHSPEPVSLRFVHVSILWGPMCPQRTDLANDGKPTEGLSFTRKQEQQHKAAQTLFPQTEKTEEPAEPAQSLSPCPGHHYTLDASPLLVHSPQWSGTGQWNTQKDRRGLMEPRLRPKNLGFSKQKQNLPGDSL